MLHYSLTVLSLTKKQRGISCFDVGFGYWEIWLGLIYDFFFPSVPLEWIKTESNPYKIFGMIYMTECVYAQVNTYSKLRVEIPRDTPEANLVKKT